MPTITIDLTERALATLMGVSPAYAHRLLSKQDGKQIGKQLSKQIKGVKSVVVNELDSTEVSSEVSKMVSNLVSKTVSSSLEPINSNSPEEKNIIIDNNKKETPQIEATPTPPEKKEPVRMKRPTLEEVTAYIKEKGYDIDPESFWHFYEANGWKQGNKPLKRWQSCCVTWARREKNNPSPPKFQKTQVVQEYTGGVTHEEFLEQRRRAAAAASVRDEIFKRRFGK